MQLPTIQACGFGMDIALTAGAGIDFSVFPLPLHTTEEFSMAQTKSTRPPARASAVAKRAEDRLYYMKRAKQAADGIADKGSRDLLEKDLATIPECE